MARYVPMVAPLQLMTPDGLSPMYRERSDGTRENFVMTWTDFCEMFLFQDEKFRKSMKSLRAIDTIQEAFDKAKEENAEYAAVPENEWDIGRDVLDNPSVPFSNPYVLRKCKAFTNAFLDAKTDKPKKKDELDKAAE